MKSILALALASGALAVGAAQAETAPAKADPAKAAPIVNQVCAACHAADGNSASPANPKLAGQHAEYITKQLRDFKAALADPNKEGVRKSAVMGAMVANLSDEDMVNLGAYFAEKSIQPGAAKQPYSNGEKLWRGGNAASGVPACAGCHGPTGAGIPVQYPRLGGQHADYIIAQLKAFRTRERQNDPAKMMRMIADRMTEQEIKDVANYIAGLK
ncbi:MAG: c-type cytochrome [Burkholderiales bacterium]